MKRSIQIVIVGLILWVVYSNYNEFKRNDLFNIQNVAIEVGNKELVKDLYESIETLKGRNILEVDEKEIKKTILEDVRIKDVVVKKKIPDTLTFIIKEKVPYAYVEYKGNIYIIDEKGDIYGYMKESGRYNMPLFRIKDEKEIDIFMEVMSKISFLSEVSQVYTANNSIVITVNNGLKIITNDKIERERYEVVIKLYNQVKLKNKENIEYIDLRFEDYIIKRAEGDQK